MALLQHDSLPPDRVGQVRYITHDSPKYAYGLLRALEAQEKGHKMLIYINHPVTAI